MALKIVRDLEVESLPNVCKALELIPSIEEWLSRWLSRLRLLLPNLASGV